MRRVAVLLAVLLATPTIARAQAPALAGDEKDEDHAVSLSVAGSIAGVGVLALGGYHDSEALLVLGGAALVFLPAMGHWYAGDADRVGLGLRLAGVALGAAGLLVASEAMDRKDNTVEGGAGDPTEKWFVLGLGTLAVGAGAVLAGVVYAGATADDAVREHNRLQVAPLAAPGVAGLSLQGSF